VWDSPQLERFDAKADLALSGTEAAVKTFDYTFLAKRPGQVPGRTVEFSYFDPNSARYEIVRRQLAEVVVAGKAAPDPTPQASVPDKSPESNAKAGTGALELTRGGRWTSTTLWGAGLALALALLALYKARGSIRWRRAQAASWDADFRRLRREGPSVGVVTRLWDRVAPDAALDPDLAYWRDALTALEHREFATSRTASDIRPTARHLRALHKALKKHP